MTIAAAFSVPFVSVSSFWRFYLQTFVMKFMVILNTSLYMIASVKTKNFLALSYHIFVPLTD
jgi:hypothetical protein